MLHTKQNFSKHQDMQKQMWKRLKIWLLRFVSEYSSYYSKETTMLLMMDDSELNDWNEVCSIYVLQKVHSTSKKVV